MRFYFGFQKFFIVDRFAIKLLFISALTLLQTVLSLLIIHQPQSKNTSIWFVHHSLFTYALVLGSIMCNGLTLLSLYK